MTNVINGIKFSNSSNSIKSYVVTAFDGYQLIDFQVEMINSNEEAGFLSIEKDNIILKFNFTMIQHLLYRLINTLKIIKLIKISF